MCVRVCVFVFHVKGHRHQDAQNTKRKRRKKKEEEEEKVKKTDLS